MKIKLTFIIILFCYAANGQVVTGPQLKKSVDSIAKVLRAEQQIKNDNFQLQINAIKANDGRQDVTLSRTITSDSSVSFFKLLAYDSMAVTVKPQKPFDTTAVYKLINDTRTKLISKRYIDSSINAAYTALNKLIPDTAEIAAIESSLLDLKAAIDAAIQGNTNTEAEVQELIYWRGKVEEITFKL